MAKNIPRSLHGMKQLEAGDFDSDELTKIFTEILTNEPQRKEILQLAGDGAALVIERLCKRVNVGEPHS